MRSPPRLALVVVLVSATISGCACSSAAHRNDPVCVLVHDVVDCTESSVIAIAPQFLPVVKGLIDSVTGADGTVDWARAEQSLLALGLRDGGCILAALEAQLTSRATPGAGPRALRQAEGYAAGFDRFRRRHWPGVRFKLADGVLR